MRKSVFNRRQLLKLTGVGIAGATAGASPAVAQTDNEESNLIEIANWNDLDAIREDLDGDYVLVNDLDGDTAGYDELVDTDSGFEPVGSESAFTGTFDGNSNEVQGLIINDRGGDVGVFIDNSGIIKNTDFTNLDIENNNNPSRGVGGLVVKNDGKIENVHVTGNIEGEASGLSNAIGGIVALNDGGTIINSSSDATVIGKSNSKKIGGIAGENLGGKIQNVHWTGKIQSDGSANTFDIGGIAGSMRGGEIGNVHVAGNIETGDDDTVGGIVGGYNFGSVSNSKVTGEINGLGNVGGLVGLTVSDGDEATITRSFAAGEINGSSDVGGLVGVNRDGNSVTESYWDTESTGQNNGIGVNRGTFDAEGLTTGEMQGSEAENNMNDLDFTDTWDVVADPDDYPILPTIEVTEGGVTVAVEPTTTQVGLDGEATVDVVVSGADAGVGAYDITGSVGDPAVASFTAIEETRTGGSGSTSIGSDGATATADRALLDEAFVSAATVTIATLTLSGEETGTTGITIDTATVGDDGGTEYTVSETQSATVEVTEGIDVTGDGTPATDTDGDGKLEDVNGDGESDVLDVQAFFENLDAEAAQNNPAAFDFNDDGDVSILDVQALFNQL